VTDTSEADGCPERVAVIGGGRWACAVAEKLCAIVPDSIGVSVHSRHNSRAVADWMAAHRLQQRVLVCSEWPRSAADANAVIVANAARDHEAAVDWALAAEIPVLVEKPLALGAAIAQQLIERARGRSLRLGAAHVFLFAAYLEKFAALAAREKDIRSMRVCWEDPRVETRFGDEKRFDPGLPVFADWLPHVSSMVGALLPGSSQRCEDLRLLRGGAHVELELAVGSVPCSVQLIRNGGRRRRVIEIAAAGRPLRLDFSTEPGRISCGVTTEDADPDWNARQSPLALMLRAFLRWAAGGRFDPRLDSEIGLRACRLIDETLARYDAALLTWLAGRLAGPGDADEDLRYALGEILQYRGLLSAGAIERGIERVRARFATVPDSGWLRALISSRATGSEYQS
jgi:predicted dehydrogenase